MDTAEFEKYVKEIVAAYEEDAKNDEIRKSRFKKTYEKIYKSIPQKDKNEFFKFCIDDPMCGRRYFKSYGDFDNHMITDDNDDDEFDFGFLDDDEEDDENTIKSFKELAHSKNMSQEDLTAVLQKYGYFSSDGEPLKKWIDAGLFDKNKQFFGNTKEGKELFDRIIDKRHKYENYHIKKLLKESGYAEKDISFDKNTIILSGIKYKCFTSSELKYLDKTKYDDIEQLYLNLSLCRIAGQIQKDDNKEEPITKDAGDDFSEWLDDDEDIPESDEIENNEQVVNENKETQVEQRIKICPSCKTQLSIKVNLCPNCGLTCGHGTIVDKKDYDLVQEIDNYKKSCSKKYNDVQKMFVFNTDLLIDKITSSIRKHSSTNLKEYLREYSLNAKGSEIKSKYDKVMATNICAAFIVEILDGLKKIFDDDETALKHIDKCSRSLNQLSYEKAKLAEILKTEEKEAESSEEDEFDFTSWDDDDTENNTQNRKPKLTEKEKKFEQLKKEILSASDINKALRFTLSNMPKEDWKDFNAYLLKDKNFRDSLNNVNPDKKEKSSNLGITEETDDVFDFSNDDDEYSIKYEDEESNKQIDEQKIAEIRNDLIQHFYSDDYDVENIIDNTIIALVNEETNKIDDWIIDLSISTIPGKDLNSIKQTAISYDKFIIVYSTCTEIGKILNTKSVNSFIRVKLARHYKTFSGIKLQIENACKEFVKKEKRKQRFIKGANVLGTILFSPLILYAKAADALDEYSSRPEVQEKRRIEEEKRAEEERKRNIKYYCVYCGHPFPSIMALTNATCTMHPNGWGGGKHKLYEGSQKSTYYCKYCGHPFPSLLSLCNGTCLQHPDGVGKGKHSPAL